MGRAADKGFSDQDSKRASYFFERVSFQHASEYFGLYPSGTTLDHIYRAVEFDRKFQAMLMEFIGVFELQFRAQYSYALSLMCGPFAHRDPANFRSPKQHAKSIERYVEERDRQLMSNPDVREAKEKYGDVPTWMAVEVMTFGTLSKLYGNTRVTKVCRSVADSFGVKAEVLGSWLHTLSLVRNRCAHFSSLCPVPLKSRPKRIGGVPADNTGAFYVVLILEKLMSSQDVFLDSIGLSYTMDLEQQAANLLYRYYDIAKACGFPDNWNELLVDERVTGHRSPPLPKPGSSRLHVQGGFVKGGKMAWMDQ